MADRTLTRPPHSLFIVLITLVSNWSIGGHLRLPPHDARLIAHRDSYVPGSVDVEIRQILDAGLQFDDLCDLVRIGISSCVFRTADTRHSDN